MRPRKTAPAARMRAAGGASSVRGVMSLTAVPKGMGTPRVAMFSLMVIGTPSSDTPFTVSGSPRRQRSSDARAASSARS